MVRKELVMFLLKKKVFPNRRQNQRDCIIILFTFIIKMIMLFEDLKLIRTMGKQTKKDPKRIWVPLEKIIYVTDILSSEIETPVMVPGLWVPATHDEKKVYVPRLGT